MQQQVLAGFVAMLALLCGSPVLSELPKTKPVCSTEWGLWWNAEVCGNFHLHWAAASGDLELARKLLDHAPETINSRDSYNWTPLNEAVFYGKQHLVIELVRRGGDLKSRGYQGMNLMKQAKLRWCVAHSTVSLCPVTINDYNMVMELIERGCEWTECYEGFQCINRRCWPLDKCLYTKCGTNAGCVVENNEPVCRCAPGFIGEDPNRRCSDPNQIKSNLLKAENLILDPCPGGYEEMLNQCLYISDFISLTWLEASARCREMGGYLATVEDPQKLSDFIINKYPAKHFWLGGSDNETEGLWLWESGNTVDEDFPWGINNGGVQQPNNADNNEHCMAIKYFSPPVGMLYVDNRCDIRNYYICEADKLY